MHTAHNWSPYQLWYHSSIAAQSDDPIDLTYYGVDPQDPPPNGFDVDLVEVPATLVTLNPEQVSLVTASVDPLQCSDLYGVGIYIYLREVIQQFGSRLVT